MAALAWALAYPCFLRQAVVIPGDLPYYLEQASNLLSGHGFRHATGDAVTVRGPVFPLLLALGAQILGPGIGSAYAVIVGAAAGSAATAAALAYRWWGLVPAFVALALYLSMPVVLGWSDNHLDAVWPLLALASIGLLRGAFRHQSSLSAAMAGGLAVVAFLTKEAAILLLPLPLFAALMATGFPKRTRLAVLATSVFLFGIGVWVAYVIAAGGTASTALVGPVATGAVVAAAGGMVPLNAGSLLAGLHNTGLPPAIVLLALAGGIVLALRGGFEERLLLAAFGALLPLTAYVVTMNLRPGQLLIIAQLIALLGGRTITSICEAAARRIATERRGIATERRGIATGLAAAATLLVALPSANAVWRHLGSTRIAHILGPETAPWTATPLFRSDGLVSLIEESGLPPNASIIVYDTELNCYACSYAAFATANRYRFFPAPFTVVTADGLELSTWMPGRAEPVQRADYLRAQFAADNPRHRLWLLSLTELLAYARRHGVDHLAVLEDATPRLRSQLTSPAFQFVASRHGYSLYRVDTAATRPDTASLVVEEAPALCGQLRTMSAEASAGYQRRFARTGRSIMRLKAYCEEHGSPAAAPRSG